jgi:hypothetical protein
MKKVQMNHLNCNAEWKGDNLNNIKHGNIKSFSKNIWKAKLVSLEQIVRTNIPETCTDTAKSNLSRVSDSKLIYKKMKKSNLLDDPCNRMQ